MGIPRIGNINTNNANVYSIGTQNIWNVQVAETYTNNIPNVYVPSWMVNQPNVDYLIPPVVVNVGNPIVDIPGCLKAHKDNKKHKTGKDTSKRRIDRRDNVGGRAISNKRNIGKYAKSTLAVEGRLDRINKTKQNAAKKKAQLLKLIHHLL